MTDAQLVEKITLRAVHGKQQGVLFLNPRTDQFGKVLGVSEDKLKSGEIDPNTTTRKIADGLVLSASSEKDKLDWLWMRENREIVNTLEEGLDEPNALFYIDQPDLDATKRIKKTNIRFEAYGIVNEMTDSQKAEFCTLLGVNAKHFRPIEVEDYLFSEVEKSPEKVIKAFKDPFKKTRVFLSSIIDKRLIVKDAHGSYRLGDQLIAINFQGLLDWVNDDRNREVVAQLYQQMYAEETKQTKDFIADLAQLQAESKPVQGKEPLITGPVDGAEGTEQIEQINPKTPLEEE